MNYEQFIGKHITDSDVKAIDWYSRFPEIDERGYITGIYDGDAIPENATLVNWSSPNKRGHIIKTDGNYGFEAVLA